MPRRSKRPDRAALIAIAAPCGGYFTSAEANDAGFRPSALAYLVRAGRVVRVGGRVYRFAEHAVSPVERIVVGWLSVGRERAVVSHGSAMYVLGVWRRPPAAVHLIVPRGLRGSSRRIGAPELALHTSRAGVPPEDIVTVAGIHVTRTARALVDLCSARGRSDGTLIESLRRATVLGGLRPGDVDRLLHRSQLRGKTRLRELMDTRYPGRYADLMVAGRLRFPSPHDSSDG